MFRFHRLAVLISAAGIAAAPGTASERGWRSEAASTVHAQEACAATARGATLVTENSQSLAPQSSQAQLRNAAAARIARLWAGRTA
jgi:hypothetical protein